MISNGQVYTILAIALLISILSLNLALILYK